jgi:GNAT superfamily N-acetyltransferase
MAVGDAVAGALREPDGRLVGCAWWFRTPSPLLRHGRWLYRVMVDPARQRRGLGRLLMAGMHRVARQDGAELLQLGVRSGSGARDFYARCGYTEVSRIPGAIRVAPGDDRDDVTMARRVDGAPLVAHGGS